MRNIILVIVFFWYFQNTQVIEEKQEFKFLGLKTSNNQTIILALIHLIYLQYINYLFCFHKMSN